MGYLMDISWPRWSRGTVLVSRSKVWGYKSGWGRWIFSGRKNPELKSFGRDFKMRVPSLRFQNLKPEKIGLWANFNLHIHVLIATFGGHNISEKVAVHWGSNDHPINTIQYIVHQNDLSPYLLLKLLSRHDFHDVNIYDFKKSHRQALVLWISE